MVILLEENRGENSYDLQAPSLSNAVRLPASFSN